MKIVENLYKKYNEYKDFASEFVRTAMELGVANLIVNAKDCLGVVSLLNTYTINGISIACRNEISNAGIEDITNIFTNSHNVDENMIITLFDSGELIFEAALPNEEAYIEDSVYYVEISAGEFVVPLKATIIPFRIGENI